MNLGTVIVCQGSSDAAFCFLQFRDHGQERRFVMATREMLRSKLVAMMVLTLLSSGTAAVAQNQGTRGAASPIIPQAPIGHRQPRPDELSSEKNLTDPNDPFDKENAILDKKLKSICRGC